MRPTVMEINLNTFQENINKIREYIGPNKDIMPVIKANAYGTHINKRIDIINNFNIVAVALANEALELRNLGYNKDIFILNGPYIDELDKIIDNNIVFGLSSIELLNVLLNSNKIVRVHLEIETGMNRTGINIKDLDIFIKKIKTNKNIVVEGIYTHLSSADYDTEYTNRQISLFKEAVNKVKSNFNKIKYIHLGASNGLINYQVPFTNLVRPGIIMYGYESYEGASEIIDIKPVCKLKSKIVFIKELDSFEYIGYSKTYMTARRSKIATIPIGYGDGISRRLSNKGYVVINGYKAPIVGNVCMDSIMVDITEVQNAKVGTDIYIWDNDKIKLDDVAEQCQTISYEVMCQISDRVPRIFLK